jgi:hypothetical protein
MPRLRRRPSRLPQLLRCATADAVRSRACRWGFLAGFAAGCAAVVVGVDGHSQALDRVSAKQESGTGRADSTPIAVPAR